MARPVTGSRKVTSTGWVTDKRATAAANAVVRSDVFGATGNMNDDTSSPGTVKFGSRIGSDTAIKFATPDPLVALGGVQGTRGALAGVLPDDGTGVAAPAAKAYGCVTTWGGAAGAAIVDAMAIAALGAAST